MEYIETKTKAKTSFCGLTFVIFRGENKKLRFKPKMRKIIEKGRNVFLFFFVFFILFAQITLIYIQISHKIETIYIGLGTF